MTFTLPLTEFSRFLGVLMLSLIMATAFFYASDQFVYENLNVILLHGQLLFSGILLLFALKLYLRFALRLTLSRAICSFLDALSIALLMAFYLICIVGYFGWGKIPTFNLVNAYLREIPLYLDSVINTALFIFVLSALVLIIIVLTIFVRRCLYGSSVRNDIFSSRKIVLIFVGVVIVSHMHLFFYVGVMSYVPKNEPFTVFFGYEGRHNRQMNDDVLSQYSANNRNRNMVMIRDGNEVYKPAMQHNTSNVILIFVDALREDRLSINGYSKKNDIFLSWLTQMSGGNYGGVRSTCTESICGIMSVLRGQFLHRMGLESMSLTDVLQLHGYKIHHLLTGDHTNFYNLRDLYGRSDVYLDGTHRQSYKMNDDAGAVNDLSKLNFDSLSKQYLQFHLMSVHGIGVRDELFEVQQPFENYYKHLFAKFNKTPDDELRFSNYYDNGVRQADDNIRKIVEILKQKKLLNDAIIVITADHGELLGEHALYSHSHPPYEPLLKVPLIMAHFKNGIPVPMSFNKDKRVTSHVQIAPLILEQLSMPSPLYWDGVLQTGSEAGAMKGDIEFHYVRQGEWCAVIQGGMGEEFKYMVNQRAGRTHFFDLNQDPSEVNDKIKTTDAKRLAYLESKLLEERACY
jgi:glucan phosphoethanolaminetransferase (alkaline phosphatase superfamily)